MTLQVIQPLFTSLQSFEICIIFQEKFYAQGMKLLIFLLAADAWNVLLAATQYWNASSALGSKPVKSWIECSSSDGVGDCAEPMSCSDYIAQVQSSRFGQSKNVIWL